MNKQRILCRRCLAMMLLFALCPLTSAMAQSSSTEIANDELRFVGQVLATVEYGPRTHDRAKKWGQAPLLRIVDATESQRQLVIATARHINGALPSQYQLRWDKLPIDPNQREEGVIRLHFCDVADFKSLSERYGFAAAPDENDGYIRVWWDHRMQIQSAVIFLAQDRLANRRIVREHTVLEELVQSLGPLGDSSFYPHSVFYEDKEKDVFGTATRLSELDKRTLRFLYTHVPSGAHATEIGFLMSKHWPVEERATDLNGAEATQPEEKP